MPKKLRDQDGLTPNEAKFAKLLCQGLTQHEAYQRAWPGSRSTPKQIDTRASLIANKPEIKRRVREILAQMKVSDLDSAGQAFKDVLSALEQAQAAKNWTAVAQLSRLRLDCHGMLKTSVGDRTGLSSISDANLLEALAGSNVELRKELEKLLGRDTFEKPAAPAPAAPAPTVAPTTTKH